MAERIWTLPEVAEITGANHRTLLTWVERGLITASIRERAGSGKTVMLSDDDLITACLVAAVRPLLTDAGLRAFLAAAPPDSERS